MLYFHNSFQDIQKSATYAAKSFQILGASHPRPLTRGCAQRPHPHHLHLQYLLFPPPNPGRLVKTLHDLPQSSINKAILSFVKNFELMSSSVKAVSGHIKV